NKSFWKKNYDLLKEYSDGQFNDISVDEFYDAINESKPSFIRIEADELTYPLHVMVRYELEKELFDGTLQVKDLPATWNDKMEAYLGIRPANDAQGVLQDVHWAGGSFGYFPSYA
ncbi:carboxypeptidase M32, partial [Vibrio cholerae]|nr:carboxypeptidase M32 [Vibrio cholerae]